jgi:hypothetical protein
LNFGLWTLAYIKGQDQKVECGISSRKLCNFAIKSLPHFEFFGSGIAGGVLPVLVIALKRNGAYAGNI